MWCVPGTAFLEPRVARPSGPSPVLWERALAAGAGSGSADAHSPAVLSGSSFLCARENSRQAASPARTVAGRPCRCPSPPVWRALSPPATPLPRCVSHRGTPSHPELERLDLCAVLLDPSKGDFTSVLPSFWFALCLRDARRTCDRLSGLPWTLGPCVPLPSCTCLSWENWLSRCDTQNTVI